MPPQQVSLEREIKRDLPNRNHYLCRLYSQKLWAPHRNKTWRDVDRCRSTHSTFAAGLSQIIYLERPTCSIHTSEYCLIHAEWSANTATWLHNAHLLEIKLVERGNIFKIGITATETFQVCGSDCKLWKKHARISLVTDIRGFFSIWNFLAVKKKTNHTQAHFAVASCTSLCYHIFWQTQLQFV